MIKKARRVSRIRSETKAERLQREKAEDEQARRRAEGPGGITTGDHEEIPQNIGDAVDEADDFDTDMVKDQGQEQEGGLFGRVPIIGGVSAKVGQGVKKGVTAVGGAGQGLLGGAKALQQGVDGQLTRTGGFEVITDDNSHQNPAAPSNPFDRPRRVQMIDDEDKPKTSFASEAPSYISQDRACPRPCPYQLRCVARLRAFKART